MAKRRRKRFYKCEGPFARKSDARNEAQIIGSMGHKVTVKKRAGGYEVCRTYKKRR